MFMVIRQSVMNKIDCISLQGTQCCECAPVSTAASPDRQTSVPVKSDFIVTETNSVHIFFTECTVNYSGGEESGVSCDSVVSTLIIGRRGADALSRAAITIEFYLTTRDSRSKSHCV